MKRGKPMPRGTKNLARTAGLSRGTGLPRTGRKRRPARDTGPSAKAQGLVWARAGSACESCGISLAGRPHSIQHIIARRMGGTSDPDANALSGLALLCGSATTPGSCHALCESRDEGMHDRGFWLYSWEGSRRGIVTLADGRTVLLGADYLAVPSEGSAAA